MVFCALSFVVNITLPRVFKETINRKVFLNKERKRARKKLTERITKKYFLMVLSVSFFRALFLALF